MTNDKTLTSREITTIKNLIREELYRGVIRTASSSLFLEREYDLKENKVLKKLLYDIAEADKIKITRKKKK